MKEPIIKWGRVRFNPPIGAYSERSQQYKNNRKIGIVSYVISDSYVILNFSIFNKCICNTDYCEAIR